jgi:hypothetical protein
MCRPYTELLPAEPLTDRDRLELLWKIWRELSMSGDAGATSWDVLDGIQAQVTEHLSFDPPNISIAESLTAKAFLLREGQSNF